MPTKSSKLFDPTVQIGWLTFSAVVWSNNAHVSWSTQALVLWELAVILLLACWVFLVFIAHVIIRVFIYFLKKDTKHAIQGNNKFSREKSPTKKQGSSAGNIPCVLILHSIIVHISCKNTWSHAIGGHIHQLQLSIPSCNVWNLWVESDLSSWIPLKFYLTKSLFISINESETCIFLFSLFWVF